MAYVAVKGGTKAIEQSAIRLKYKRLKNNESISYKNIASSMRGLVDQIMSESSLYSKDLAALAIKQAEGNVEEAVFILRAFRSTLQRNYVSKTVEQKDIKCERRISAAFKDIPGGQILGASHDYTHRLLDFNLMNENENDIENFLSDFSKEQPSLEKFSLNNKSIIEMLRDEGVIKNPKGNDNEPKDITKEELVFPLERSQRLQMLTRGSTGAVISFGYAAIRGFGAFHPTIGDLRVGTSKIYIQTQDENEEYYIGEIELTYTEVLMPISVKKNDKNVIEFEIGAGICFGQNESKAIAMGVLDRCLEIGDKKYPTNDEEFILLHIDSLESTGFISHLKLPHYVTFQSMLQSVRNTKGEN